MAERAWKLAAALGFGLIIAALFLIRGSVATGYELSIYTATPTLVWAFLIASIAIGVAVIARQAFSPKESHFWLVGFLLLLTGNAVVVFLHALKGYYLPSSGDAQAHLGFTRDILSLEVFPRYNLYPVTHLLTAQLSLVMNIAAETANRYLPGLYSLLFMVFTFLLARASLGERGAVLLAAAASVTLQFGQMQLGVWPQGLGVLFFPFLIYLFLRQRQNHSVAWKALFLGILFLYPYLHANPATMVIAALLAMEVAWTWYRSPKAEPRLAWVSQVSPNPILISVVVLFLWLSNYLVFDTTISSLVSTIRGEPYGSAVLARGLMALQAVQGWELVTLYLKMYGHNLLYIALAGVAALLILWRARSRAGGWEGPLVLVAFFVLALPITFFLFFSTRALTLGRMLALNYQLVVAPVLLAFLLYTWLKGRAWWRIPITVLIITLSATIGLFSLYRSPYVLQPNLQATYRAVRGTEWVIDYKDTSPERVVRPLGLFFEAYGQSILGGYKYSSREDLQNSTSRYIQDPEAVPEHYGYYWGEWLGSWFDRDFYLLLAPMQRLAGDNPLLSEKGLYMAAEYRKGFTPEDYRRLRQDRSLDIIYTNGEAQVVYVRSSG